MQVKALLQELNVLRGAHHLAPVLIRSTVVMCHAVCRWVRAENKPPAKSKKARAEKPDAKKETSKGEKKGGETAGRIFLLLTAGYLAVWMSAPRPWTWWAWGAAWFVSCFVIAAVRGDIVPEHERAADTPEDEPDEGEPEQDSADTTQNDHETVSAGEQHPDPARTRHADTTEIIRQYVEHAVAAATHPDHANPAVRGKGARVEDLLAGLQAGGGLPGWDTKRFRDLLDTAGVPVRDQMYFKVNGRKSNCPGVHVEDLTQALGRAPRLAPHLAPDLTPHQPVEHTPAGGTA